MFEIKDSEICPKLKQDKNPEKEVNKTETSNLQIKSLKMLNELGRIKDKYSENYNKQFFKKSELKIQEVK